jgi:hypothetical protein
MKIRSGFVSNSSSSSFIIQKKNLTADQINKIYDHIEFAKVLIKYNPELEHTFYCGKEDRWDIEDKETYLFASTNMDNFDMREFLKLINVSENDFKYQSY